MIRNQNSIDQIKLSDLKIRNIKLKSKTQTSNENSHQNSEIRVKIHKIQFQIHKIPVKIMFPQKIPKV